MFDRCRHGCRETTVDMSFTSQGETLIMAVTRHHVFESSGVDRQEGLPYRFLRTGLLIVRSIVHCDRVQVLHEVLLWLIYQYLHVVASTWTAARTNRSATSARHKWAFSFSPTVMHEGHGAKTSKSSLSVLESQKYTCL